MSAASGMEAEEVLSKAADLLEKPGAWTQGACARDGKGRPVKAWLKRAVCFCAYGAIQATCGRNYGPEYNTATDAFEATLGPEEFISEFNDAPGRTQAEVVAALRAAASQAHAPERQG